MAYRNKGIWGAGIGAGIIGGIVMAAATMMYTAGTGMGFWTPLRVMAATTSGVDALIGGGGTLLWGLMIHMVISIAFGVILAALLPRRVGAGAAFGWGLIYGIAVWAFTSYAVLPWANPTMLSRLGLMGSWWFFAHLIFGGVTGALIPPFRGRATAATPAGISAIPERRVA